MPRRIEVIYDDETSAPEITFEGVWNRRLLDNLYFLMLKRLKGHKAELIKEGNKKLIKAKK